MEAGKTENPGVPDQGEGGWREDRIESECLQFSRGEVGIDHENFSRTRRGKKKRPQNRICKYAEMGEFSEQIPSPDITQIWLGWHGLGWHSLLGTWAPVLLLASAPYGLGPRPSSESYPEVASRSLCHSLWQ